MARPPKIAVLLDSHYDGTETSALQNFFPVRGFEVEFIGYLRGASQAVFFNNNNPSETITVTKDIGDVDLLEYTGLIAVGGYAMDMIRYEQIIEEGSDGRPVELPKASEFAIAALGDPEITVGTICHSLWVFTPDPSALAGRKVTCGHNIIYDVLNAGATLAYDTTYRQLAGSWVDGNLVTGRHPFAVQEFMQTYYDELVKKG
ncbi:DJ-1/PfpI family protein [Dolichospermum lemmermannii CS-548]|jgi:protease I|uniref:DJ-1/PfpI family protein n=1 Tax=Dolichospermum lemmermannii TaxID=54295 RepID=UPI00232E87D0|nr:DJ-1/PfpI family protein [Dolichospermum lemmermannii]MDB9438596.1 DJ-1/PfpI family protein [Dolichospermum lemmermannii CS-548]